MQQPIGTMLVMFYAAILLFMIIRLQFRSRAAVKILARVQVALRSE